MDLWQPYASVVFPSDPHMLPMLPSPGGQKPEFLHLDGQAEADKATHGIKEINKSGPKICRVVSRRFNSLGQLGMMTARDPEDSLSTRSILDG